MNNKELAAALREMKKRQETCICNYACCSECGCWDKSCEEEGCNILVMASEAMERADDYEKILADFSKVVNDGFQAMAERKEKRHKWISVDDSLPNYFTSVLVWCPGNKCIYAAYRNARQEWYTFDDTIAGRVVINIVTHWMPMPDPPELEVGMP